MNTFEPEVTAFDLLTPIVTHIYNELERVFTAEGTPVPTLTGNMLIVPEIGAVWFELKDETNTLTWVTADMPMRAAWGETLVIATSREEALTYDESN